MTADDVIRLLKLSPHPTEGGQFLQTYAAEERIELPGYPSARRTSTAIYYLLETDTFSEIHRLRSMGYRVEYPLRAPAFGKQLGGSAHQRVPSTFSFRSNRCSHE